MNESRMGNLQNATSLFRLLMMCVLASLVSPGCAEETNGPSATGEGTVSGGAETYFTVSGDVEASVDAAEATLVKIRGSIPAMTIVSAPSSIRKLGTSYSVNLFFSEEFEPKPGVYPVEFSYRKKPNSLGGSFIHRGTRFSHDTEGTAEFTEFGDRVRVRFEFQAYDRSEGKEGRRHVVVKGEAVSAPAEIF